MAVLAFLRRHPYVGAGVVLAAGMVVMLVLAARGNALTSSQLAFLVLATLALAVLCAWVMSWNSGDDA